MMEVFVTPRTHIQAHYFHLLNQGGIVRLGGGYQRGVQGPTDK